MKTYPMFGVIALCLLACGGGEAGAGDSATLPDAMGSTSGLPPDVNGSAPASDAAPPDAASPDQQTGASGGETASAGDLGSSSAGGGLDSSQASGGALATAAAGAADPVGDASSAAAATESTEPGELPAGGDNAPSAGAASDGTGAIPVDDVSANPPAGSGGADVVVAEDGTEASAEVGDGTEAGGAVDDAAVDDATTVDAPVDPGRDVHFEQWPAGTSPAEIGLKLARLFLDVGINQGDAKHYKQACAWYGALAVAALLGEQELVDDLTVAYAPHIESYAALLASEGHVDNNVFGIVPLEIALHDANPVYLADGLALADHQQANIDGQIRYAIDDMFMITGLQMQAYRATGDGKYRDLAASTMVKYLDRLQQPDGTFHHHEDVLIKWGRGNGWVASGMTEMMRDMDDSHPDYQRIREGYEEMMAGLLGYQIKSGEGAGLWKQVLDYDGADNWAETSGSAMFTYAMVSGVRNGWLDPDIYGPAARDAWLGLAGYLEPDGKLKGVSDWMWDGSVADYVARARVTGDNHGQAPFLWAAAALLR